MKKTVILSVLIASVFGACNQNKEAAQTTEPEVQYSVFGDSITAADALDKEAMLAKYEGMKEGDTLEVKFTSKIQAVCKKKGCWMNLDLGKDKSAFVKFKDYGFFVPTAGAEAHDAVISGKAFLNITSVDELKHYAKDGGKSQAAIDSIVAPEVKYGFVANGALIAM